MTVAEQRFASDSLHCASMLWIAVLTVRLLERITVSTKRNDSEDSRYLVDLVPLKSPAPCAEHLHHGQRVSPGQGCGRSQYGRCASGLRGLHGYPLCFWGLRIEGYGIPWRGLLGWLLGATVVGWGLSFRSR